MLSTSGETEEDNLHESGEDTSGYQTHSHEVTLAESDIRWPSRVKCVCLSSVPLREDITVVTLPRLPKPDTKAVALPMPTSPCLGPNSSAAHVIQMGTVGPNPNPAIRRPE